MLIDIVFRVARLIVYRSSKKNNFLSLLDKLSLPNSFKWSFSSLDKLILQFSTILNEFWHFWICSWNSDTIFSSKIRRKISLLIEPLWSFEWIIILKYQNCDDLLLKCWSLSGAKVCESCRSQRKCSFERWIFGCKKKSAAIQPRSGLLKFGDIYSFFQSTP